MQAVDVLSELAEANRREQVRWDPEAAADPGNRTFTSPSPPDYRRARGAADTTSMEFAGRLFFMAAVTCYLLGRIFAGEVTPIETVVYGATAALGLEFVIAAWDERWTPR